MAEEVSAVSLSCSNCSAPLMVPRNAGKVFCQYCGAENIVQGVDRNAEVKKKLDINSGFPFELNNATLHSLLITAIENDDYAPLDIFQELNVLGVEKAVVPAYYLYCNGTLNYNYELGMQRERQRVEKRGDSLYTVTETYTEWLPQTSVASHVQGFFSPANQEMADLVMRLYSDANANDLIDIEGLDYGAECNFYDNNIPVTVSFGSYVKPAMDDILVDRAVASLQGRQFRNVTPNGSTVLKDQEVRVLLPIYIIKFEYQDKLYKIYLNKNSSQCYIPELPIDQSRFDAIKAKEAERDAIKAGTGLLTAGFVISIVVTAISFFCTLGGLYGFIALIILGIGGIVVTSIFKSKKNKIAAEKRAAVQAQIDAMKQQFYNIVAQFRAAKVPFRGVFENLAGNPDAFD